MDVAFVGKFLHGAVIVSVRPRQLCSSMHLSADFTVALFLSVAFCEMQISVQVDGASMVDTDLYGSCMYCVS